MLPLSWPLHALQMTRFTACCLAHGPCVVLQVDTYSRLLPQKAFWTLYCKGDPAAPLDGPSHVVHLPNVGREVGLIRLAPKSSAAVQSRLIATEHHAQSGVQLNFSFGFGDCQHQRNHTHIHTQRLQLPQAGPNQFLEVCVSPDHLVDCRQAACLMCLLMRLLGDVGAGVHIAPLPSRDPPSYAVGTLASLAHRRTLPQPGR